jgi:uncharacterized protein with HEPN domain
VSTGCFLTDIVESIDEIEEFTSGMDFTEFLNDRKATIHLKAAHSIIITDHMQKNHH